MGVIYKITNVLDGKVYIGQTMRKFEDRKKEHLKSFKDNKSQTVLIKAVLKHGVDNFNFEVVEECNNDQIDEKEIYYIKQYNSKAPNGYNVRSGGREKLNTTNSNRHTVAKPVYQYTIEGDFIKEFKSASQAALELNIHNTTISQCCRGERLSTGGFIWSRKKVDNFNNIEKIKIYHNRSLENNIVTYVKNIYQFDLNGTLLNKYSSVKDASLATNISEQAIYKCLSKKNKISKRMYKWSYFETLEIGTGDQEQSS
jgi:hypothetical protein